MSTQAQDFVVYPPRRQLIEAVFDLTSPSAIAATTFTATTRPIIEAEVDELLTADDFVAVASGEAQIRRGEYVTLSELQSAPDE